MSVSEISIWSQAKYS